MYRKLPKILESLEVLDWKLANIIPIYKKGVREDPGRPVGTISEPGKIMVKFTLAAGERHLKNNAIIRQNQQSFTKESPV